MFIEIPANKNSLGQRKNLYGKGVNDAEYNIRYNNVICPFYSVWKSMFTRCYDEKYHNKQPTYRDCYICEEWHLFSNFKSWMIKQDWKAKQIDKDILVQGNKQYSPERCIFVTRKINSLFNNHSNSRGKLPLGVWKNNDRFSASCNNGHKISYLGMFNTIKEASDVYKKFKYDIIAGIANKQTEPLKSALLAYKLEGDYHG